MGRQNKGVSGAVVALLLLLSSCPMAHAVEDAIIAVVNDDIITLKNFKDYVHSLFTQLRMEGKSNSEIQRIMQEMEQDGISHLIEDKLILTEANRVGLEVRPEIIEQRLTEIKHSYKSEQDFLKALLSEGATVSELKTKLHDQFKIKFMVEKEVKSKVVVNPQEVTDYYKENFEAFQEPAKVELLSIYLPKKDDPDAARQQAKDILLQIIEGEDFKRLMDTYSQGAPVGTIEKGQVLPAIENAVFGLKEGEVSKIIELEEGFYIFKVVKQIPHQIATLDEVKDIITEKIFQDKFRKRFNIWIEELKKQAYIDIKS
ncbi:MAG TPA: peptidyl-prolyl cis-trans isomerase [Candidatus Omnitrophota bacterium]|nr:peptidyl-prolyl cis-trans isomerase [Candidatus Omnitrophota bacterium]HPB67425.1 peptidyl-prolyl cis-trans isomerase [Candidatus Omnitrophota bacterium]HQO58092.1 peptidyl-prolyl cis-trans isomerase [Candidatus Omnitrophota bacterium]